ncbi:ExeA family protein [Salinisphaera aquimarina]|uniref:ExeA family protein n=1 Tax=Salinisphaera aquimarina TaxID=2094031 RepID=A0ABV7ESE8_9GAMM
MYEKFYGLRSRPFQLMPDPRLLFESRDHVRALSYLLYGLERNEGFVVITGDVGTGKTLLLQSLLVELSGRNLAVARVAMANLGADSVVPSVAAAFGLPYKDRGKLELLDALVARLQARKGKGALLIVDEAQACSVEALEELRALANLQSGGQALMQIALIGQTELRDLLSSATMSHLRQRVVAAHHLQPLADDEVRGYVEHRLRRVEWDGDPAIDGAVYPRVHEWSGGVPRRINMLMDRFLLYGFLEEQHVLTIAELNTVITEFEQELGAHPLVWTNDTSRAGSAEDSSPVAAGRLDALGERLRTMEQALRNAVGGKRMEELLAAHRIDIESRAVIDAELRLKCLEGVFADVKTDLNAPARAAEEKTPAVPVRPVQSPPQPQPSSDVVDQIRPAASRVEVEEEQAPRHDSDIRAFDPDEEWLDESERPASRLFFWRSRDRD